MTIRGIIFDLGWTLVDFTGDIPATTVQRARDLERFLRGNGFEPDGMAVFTSYREEMGRLQQAGAALNYEYPARLAMLRALRRYLRREDAAQVAKGALHASFECIIPLWQLYPDTLSTLSALRDAGYRLGCVSNTYDGAHVQRMIDHCGLRPWLSPIYTSEEIGLRKPHPYLFQMVLDRWHLSPPEVVMVGDTLDADVLGAQNAGLRGIWIDRGPVNPWSDNEASKKHVRADATIEQLSELPGLLTGDWGRRQGAWQISTLT